MGFEQHFYLLFESLALGSIFLLFVRIFPRCKPFKSGRIIRYSVSVSAVPFVFVIVLVDCTVVIHKFTDDDFLVVVSEHSYLSHIQRAEERRSAVGVEYRFETCGIVSFAVGIEDALPEQILSALICTESNFIYRIEQGVADVVDDHAVGLCGPAGRFVYLQYKLTVVLLICLCKRIGEAAHRVDYSICVAEIGTNRFEGNSPAVEFIIADISVEHDHYVADGIHDPFIKIGTAFV